MRVLVAGVLGAAAMFIWTALAHMVTPLGMIGFQQLPNEPAAVEQIYKAGGEKRGFYFFPYMPSTGADQAAMERQQAKLKTMPSGILVYTPPGDAGMTPTQLITEFALQFVETLLAAAIIGLATVAGFLRRWVMAVMVGAVAAIATNFSYWNWYGFNLDYTIAQAFTEAMKFVIAGLVIAWVFTWKRLRKAA
jgi:hypothetical protein